MDLILNGITGEEGRDMTVSFGLSRMTRLPADWAGGYDQDSDTSASSFVRDNGWTGITGKLFANHTRSPADSQIKKRGAAPLGGGQVIFKCPIVRTLKTLQFLEKGKIKKIRGVA